MEGWADFCVAQIGASAALAGLVFVGASINLAKIAAAPQLVNIVLQALLVLATVLGACSIVLASHQTAVWVGWEVLAFVLSLWLGLSIAQYKTYRSAEARYRRSYLLYSSPGQAALLTFIASGIWLLAGGEAGLILYLPGTLLCYAAALNYAWVLLIEINR